MVLAGVTVLLITNRFNDSIGSLARACLGKTAASCPAFFVVAIASG